MPAGYVRTCSESGVIGLRTQQGPGPVWREATKQDSRSLLASYLWHIANALLGYATA